MCSEAQMGSCAQGRRPETQRLATTGSEAPLFGHFSYATGQVASVGELDNLRTFLGLPQSTSRFDGLRWRCSGGGNAGGRGLRVFCLEAFALGFAINKRCGAIVGLALGTSSSLSTSPLSSASSTTITSESSLNSAGGSLVGGLAPIGLAPIGAAPSEERRPTGAAPGEERRPTGTGPGEERRPTSAAPIGSDSATAVSSATAVTDV